MVIWYYLTIIFTFTTQLYTIVFLLRKIQPNKLLQQTAPHYWLTVGFVCLAFHSLSLLALILPLHYLSVAKLMITLGSMFAILSMGLIGYSLNVIYQQNIFLKKFARRFGISEIALFTFIITVIIVVQYFRIQVTVDNSVYVIKRTGDLGSSLVIFGGGTLLFFEILVSFYNVVRVNVKTERYLILGFPVGLFISLSVLMVNEYMNLFPNYLYLLPLGIGQLIYLIGITRTPILLFLPPDHIVSLLHDRKLFHNDGIMVTNSDFEIIYVNEGFIHCTGYNYEVLTKNLNDVLRNPKVIDGDHTKITKFSDFLKLSSFRITVIFEVAFNRNVAYIFEKIYRGDTSDSTFLLRLSNVSYDSLLKTAKHNTDVNHGVTDLQEAISFLNLSLDLLDRIGSKYKIDEIKGIKENIHTSKYYIIRHRAAQVEANKNDLEYVEISSFLKHIFDSIPTSNGIKLISEICDINGRVAINKNDFQLIFLNIIQNAKDEFLASPNSSNKFIKVRSEKIELPDGDGILQNYVSIKIINNGPPIDRNIRDKIFDQYYTTKAQRGNLGLGLSNVREIVAYHEGFVEVDSSENTVFTIYLPIFTS